MYLFTETRRRIAHDASPLGGALETLTAYTHSSRERMRRTNINSIIHEITKISAELYNGNCNERAGTSNQLDIFPGR